MRFGVRRALTESSLRSDGSLLREGQKLSQDAVNDLTAWSAEKGLISLRAAQILVIHYGCVLNEQPDETLPKLVKIIQDPHSPPLLRIELAKLLFQNKALDASVQETLLDQANPAPLRLMSAEALLSGGPNVRAIVCLREIARLPNRELALNTAAVVQRCLGIDLGLALGQALPPLNSPRCVEVTRRLMSWASQPDADNVLDTNFQPMSRLSSIH
jgi:hypothetical protein